MYNKSRNEIEKSNQWNIINVKFKRKLNNGIIKLLHNDFAVDGSRVQ